MLLGAAVLAGCGRAGAPDAPAAESAWATVNAAFGDDLHDPAARTRRFSGAAIEQLVLARELDVTRYRFLHPAELRRLTPERLAGEAAFTVDGWPAAVTFELGRTGDGGWRVESVAPPEEQRRLMTLLGPLGLPIVRDAEPWNGGLAGRDAAGRPTAAVLLLALEGALYVDGVHRVPNRREPAVEALRAALATRTALARDAHATYRPQVAIALSRDVSALRHALLARWAEEAGAEALMLVVRRADGGPGQLPLARRAPAAPGTHPVVAVVRQDIAAVTLSVGEDTHTLPRAAGAVDDAALADAFARLHAAHPTLAGVVIEADPDGAHGALVSLLRSAQRAAGELPIATADPS